MPDPLRRRGPGSQNLSGMATRPGEVVVEEVDRGGSEEPTWMQGLESVMERKGKESSEVRRARSHTACHANPRTGLELRAPNFFLTRRALGRVTGV